MEAETNILDRIRAEYESLPKSHKKIADFIVSRFQDVIFFSISEFATALGTSEAGIFRFAQYFGFSGYPDLKKELIKYYKEQLDPESKIRSSLGEYRGSTSLYADMIEQEIGYLRLSTKSVDKATFEASVDRLVGSSTVYAYGSGSNESLAHYLCYRLNRFQLRTGKITETGKELCERLIRLRTEDFVVVYSFNKTSFDVAVLLEHIKERGIPSLLITNTRIPPVMKNTDLVLAAERGPFGTFQSPLVPMAITNALIVGVAERLGDRAVDSLKEISSLRKRYYGDELSGIEFPI
jgi:DNA-binding MurR/RpiR family transcriptional regulator